MGKKKKEKPERKRSIRTIIPKVPELRQRLRDLKFKDDDEDLEFSDNEIQFLVDENSPSLEAGESVETVIKKISAKYSPGFLDDDQQEPEGETAAAAPPLPASWPPRPPVPQTPPPQPIRTSPPSQGTGLFAQSNELSRVRQENSGLTKKVGELESLSKSLRNEISNVTSEAVAIERRANEWESRAKKSEKTISDATSKSERLEDLNKDEANFKKALGEFMTEITGNNDYMAALARGGLDELVKIMEKSSDDKPFIFAGKPIKKDGEFSGYKIENALRAAKREAMFREGILKRPLVPEEKSPPSGPWAPPEEKGPKKPEKFRFDAPDSGGKNETLEELRSNNRYSLEEIMRMAPIDKFLLLFNEITSQEITLIQSNFEKRKKEAKAGFLYFLQSDYISKQVHVRHILRELVAIAEKRGAHFKGRIEAKRLEELLGVDEIKFDSNGNVIWDEDLLGNIQKKAKDLAQSLRFYQERVDMSDKAAAEVYGRLGAEIKYKKVKIGEDDEGEDLIVEKPIITPEMWKELPDKIKELKEAQQRAKKLAEEADTKRVLNEQYTKQLEEERASLENELRAANELSGVQQNRISELEARIAESNGELEKRSALSKEELEALENRYKIQLAEAEEANEELRKELSSLKGQLTKAKNEADKGQEETAALRAERAAHKAEIAEKNAGIRTLTKQVEDLELKKKLLEGEIKGLHTRIEKLKEDNENYLRDSKSTAKILTSLQSVNTGLREKNSALEEKLRQEGENYTANLEKLQNEYKERIASIKSDHFSEVFTLDLIYHSRLDRIKRAAGARTANEVARITKEFNERLKAVETKHEEEIVELKVRYKTKLEKALDDLKKESEERYKEGIKRIIRYTAPDSADAAYLIYDIKNATLGLSVQGEEDKELRCIIESVVRSGVKDCGPDEIEFIVDYYIDRVIEGSYFQDQLYAAENKFIAAIEDATRKKEEIKNRYEVKLKEEREKTAKAKADAKCANKKYRTERTKNKKLTDRFSDLIELDGDYRKELHAERERAESAEARVGDLTDRFGNLFVELDGTIGELHAEREKNRRESNRGDGLENERNELRDSLKAIADYDRSKLLNDEGVAELKGEVSEKLHYLVDQIAGYVRTEKGRDSLIKGLEEMVKDPSKTDELKANVPKQLYPVVDLLADYVQRINNLSKELEDFRKKGQNIDHNFVAEQIGKGNVDNLEGKIPDYLLAFIKGLLEAMKAKGVGIPGTTPSTDKGKDESRAPFAYGEGTPRTPSWMFETIYNLYFQIGEIKGELIDLKRHSSFYQDRASRFGNVQERADALDSELTGLTSQAHSN